MRPMDHVGIRISAPYENKLQWYAHEDIRNAHHATSPAPPIPLLRYADTLGFIHLLKTYTAAADPLKNFPPWITGTDAGVEVRRLRRLLRLHSPRHDAPCSPYPLFPRRLISLSTRTLPLMTQTLRQAAAAAATAAATPSQLAASFDQASSTLHFASPPCPQQLQHSSKQAWRCTLLPPASTCAQPHLPSPLTPPRPSGFQRRSSGSEWLGCEHESARDGVGGQLLFEGS